MGRDRCHPLAVSGRGLKQRAATVAIVLLVPVLAASGCGGSTHHAEGSSSHVVKAGGLPPRVAGSLRTRYRGTAYLATRLPDHYRYLGWFPAKNGYAIRYSPSVQGFGLTFLVAEGRNSCGGFGRVMRTFRANGEAVRWSGTHNDQHAWRCLHRQDGQPLVISASGSIPGDDNLGTPRGLSDARQLATVVGYARLPS